MPIIQVFMATVCVYMYKEGRKVRLESYLKFYCISFLDIGKSTAIDRE